uniref:UL31 n=1 Tax=Meleagrid herpesvirus 1 TaxID=37108 RepID=Q9E1G1_MEHV1|nr:UL31 [Meleagrid alphaherpesvirus 1]
MTGYSALPRRKSARRSVRSARWTRRQGRDSRTSVNSSKIDARKTYVNTYRAYFEFIAESPSEELMVVKDLIIPLIKTTSISLPFNLAEAVADNCLSLSGMGYYIGVGGCCPTCISNGEPRLGRNDRAALILAYVQQINDIYKYRVFFASIIAVREKMGNGEEKCRGAETALTRIISIPELFFAYYVLLDSGVKNVKVLFYKDHEAGDNEYMMYVVFPGKSLHLHHRLIDCLKTACNNYYIIAHVWRTNFVLIIRKDYTRHADLNDVPAINADDIYCKLCDLNIDGELLLEYGKLYATFDDFLPPR